MSSGRGRSQRGFTYLVAMFAVAIAGLLLSVTSEVSSHSRQREKEKELLYVGGQFREAIALYYQRTPGDVKQDRKSTRLNSSHTAISYAVFCLKKKRNH